MSTMVSRTADVTDIFTDRGSCDGCGECCGQYLPLTKKEIKRLKRYVRRNGVKPTPEFLRYGDKYIFSCLCPFLGSDRRCMVYDVRPAICRAYRCDRHKTGTMEAPEWDSMPKVVDMRKVFG